MAKIIEGAALIAGGVLMLVFAPEAAPAWYKMLEIGAVEIGGSLLMAGIAQELAPGPSLPTSIMQPAAYRQIAYGYTRVAGTYAYLGTTSSGIVLHEVIKL